MEETEDKDKKKKEEEIQTLIIHFDPIVQLPISALLAVPSVEGIPCVSYVRPEEKPEDE